MRIVLVGADFEENLALGMLAAVAREDGHAVRVQPFNTLDELEPLAQALAAEQPEVIGLSMQFQHRAHEFLALARRTRVHGYRGHLTTGGHFPTLAWEQALGSGAGLDSVVLYEGETTFRELLAALATGRPLREVAGLALPGELDGPPVRTPCRGLPDLEALPFPERYRPHARHADIPFIPILGSRGCWGACTYCSITSFYRDARAQGGAGQLMRWRSPENVAAEMALLWHAAGRNAAIFCFHDDNLLLPRPEATIERLRAIRAALDDFGVGRAGIIGKCRPDSLTPELARELAAVGVVRLYVGVENASSLGSQHLNRRVETERVKAALAACHAAGIFCCYNLLLFEPEATLEDIAENIAFIREQSTHPVNFCRAEPYHGTPLQLALASKGALGGSYLGYDYRVTDDRTELLFRICAAAFRQRNFAPDGVHNRYMGLGYQAKLLETFHDERGGERARLMARAARLTSEIALETADLLEQAHTLARTADLGDRDRLERETALLGLRIAAADGPRHAELDELLDAMHAFAVQSTTQKPRTSFSLPPQLTQAVRRLAQGVALSTLLSAWGCDSRAVTDSGVVVDPVPRDGRVNDANVGFDGGVDPVPMDMRLRDGRRPDLTVVDCVPPDRGVQRDTGKRPDGMIADPVPWDMGMRRDAGVPQDAAKPKRDGIPVDPPPQDAPKKPAPQSSRPIDQWRDTTPRRAVRSMDLPFFDPPEPALQAERELRGVRVRLSGVEPNAAGVRWEGDGVREGSGLEVLWVPTAETDQLRVGVRTHGGVAVLALRAGDVPTLGG
ncbi:MAG: radical SAM protein [Deltaproteobacteria bacterium]|nr:radical SAM protein [Deltaproteobacteria bacterium]